MHEEARDAVRLQAAQEAGRSAYEQRGCLGQKMPGRGIGAVNYPKQQTNERMLGVTEAEVRIHDGLDVLADSVEELEERLRDVLAPALPLPTGGVAAATPRAIGSPLAERMRTSADRVSALAAQVRSILGRLEV